MATTEPADGAAKFIASKQTGMGAAKAFGRRDALLNIEKAVQSSWEGKYEEDAPPEGDNTPKYLLTFPYPYMNGKLHLGHAFTVTRAEFAARFERMRGKKVLFPFAFHCTGMPIKACADRLARELNPKDEDDEPEQAPVAATPTTSPAEPKINESGEKKGKSKKSKANSKKGTGVTQHAIMKTMGISEEDIPKFADANYWLEYFPPLAERDLKAMGAAVDWRRSFITTDVNKYYDQFVRWQFNKLREKGYVQYGKRYDIFSPMDGQPCADHDRSVGEGVGTQEYVLIKLQLQQPYPACLEGVTKKIFLVAGTLRPETMFGQTNCWVLPSGTYGAFNINENEVFVCSERAARNMAFQGMSLEPGVVDKVCDVMGTDLIGKMVKAPCSTIVPVLPMLTISLDKATGVVTSVPSDAPDDYQSLKDLQDDAKLRNKLNVKEEWVKDLKIIPIINIPGLGDTCAVTVCQDLGVKNQNERDKLIKAKELTYTKGFYEGVMLVPEFKGMKVQDAKPVVKELLIKNGEAVNYCEPDGLVVSRSGEECVVAHCDQWYLTYGEEKWRALTEKYLEDVRTWHPETKGNLQHALGWIHQWACSRSYGLGTRLPWDEKWLIESLSDSTIYMAFYTIAHMLQNGDMYGRSPSSIKPEQLVYEFFEYVFLTGTYAACQEAWRKANLPDVPEETMIKMKREFNYWYPVDIRVSGKDLVNNHLTFYLYNHSAIFPADKQPRGIRSNGHVLVDGEKMSKSKGNFLTLEDAIKLYSADAMRFACADAGDALDDANFVDECANKAILRLTTLLSWACEVLNIAEEGQTDKRSEIFREGGDRTFFDHVFEEQLQKALNETYDAYDNMIYRDVVRCGFHELCAARDSYRLLCGANGMSRELCVQFLRVFVACMSPVCPHVCCHVWEKLLKETTPFLKLQYPAIKPVNIAVLDTCAYIEEQVKNARRQLQNPKIKATPVGLRCYVAAEYPEWQRACLQIMRDLYDKNTKKFAEDNVILAKLKENEVIKPQMKKAMPFIKHQMGQVAIRGERVMGATPLVDELRVLNENVQYVSRQLDLPIEAIHMFEMHDAKCAKEDAAKIALVVPGQPQFVPIY